MVQVSVSGSSYSTLLHEATYLVSVLITEAEEQEAIELLMGDDYVVR